MSSVTNPFSSLSLFCLCEPQEMPGLLEPMRVALAAARGFSGHKNRPALKQRLANLSISAQAHSASRQGVPLFVSLSLFLYHCLSISLLFCLLDTSQSESDSSPGGCI